MTPVFCCGFECGGNSTHIGLGATASIDTTTFNNGARSLRLHPSSQTTGTASSGINLSGKVAVVRVYMKPASNPTASTHMISTNLGGVIAGLRFNSADSKWYAAFGTTLSSSGLTLTNAQHLVDFKIDVTNNPWTLDISIDGTAIPQLTNAVAGSNLVNSLDFGSSTSNSYDIYFDDFVISLTGTDYPIGAGFVNHFVPTSDGTHNVAGAGDFKHGTAGTDITNSTTDAWTLVDDVPLPSGTPSTTDLIGLIAPPNATDYVEVVMGPASGISTPTVAPRAVEAIIAIHQAGTGTGNMEVRLNDNGTNNAIYSATTVAGTTGFTYKRKHYATAPTGGAWTVTSGNGDFNNLKVRFGSPASVDANPDQYLDAVMIEAEFAPLAPTTKGDSRLLLLGVGR